MKTDYSVNLSCWNDYCKHCDEENNMCTKDDGEVVLMQEPYDFDNPDWEGGVFYCQSFELRSGLKELIKKHGGNVDDE